MYCKKCLKNSIGAKKRLELASYRQGVPNFLPIAH